MHSIVPLAAVLLCFRRALRNFRMSVLASTHFIGARENNFSQNFNSLFMSSVALQFNL
jgi:hypothetical protein